MIVMASKADMAIILYGDGMYHNDLGEAIVHGLVRLLSRRDKGRVESRTVSHAQLLKVDTGTTAAAATRHCSVMMAAHYFSLHSGLRSSLKPHRLLFSGVCGETSLEKGATPSS